jgi:uncharacterized protein (TIGR03083 family)
VDPIAEWTRAQHRVVALVADAPDPEVQVPACPDWTVHDLFAHMVGLGADVVAGDEPDDHNAMWTAAQVEKRRGRTVAELVAEWEEIGEPLREWMRAHGSRPLGDVIIHEQDLRGALHRPGARDTPGLQAIRERFAGRLAARLPPAPSIALVGETWRWTPTGTLDEAPVLIRASDFDLTRLLMTRRSAAQLARWTERGDVGPYRSAFESLGPLPEQDLTDD